MATTPGTAWRGLAPYREDEHGALLGRDRDRDELIQMITATGYRAGLLHGERGVGKTSLVAAVLPHLREQGAVVVTCADPTTPAESLAAGLAATGAQPTAGEAPSAFIARVVSNAPPSQLFLFVLDDIELALAGPNGLGDERITQELAEVFARSMARASGRARFLYVASSERVHVFGHLEHRTGSLFPPTCRHELRRLPPDEASAVLGGLLAGAGEPGLPEAVVAGLGRGGPVLPADLQIALLGLRELHVTSVAQLVRAGGGGELERHWLEGAARASGDERRALRALAELASDDAGGAPAARTAADIGAPLSLHADEVERIMAGFAARGAVVRAGPALDRWRLAHEVLAARVRELTAPARAAARRAHELLGARAATGTRLSPRELWDVRLEGLAPTRDDERRVLDASRRFYKTIAIAVAALPVVLLVFLWFLQRGNYYLALTPRPGGDRIVVKAGRAGLSAFDWLPSSPGFGDSLVDTGLSRPMVEPRAWAAVTRQELGGGLAGWDRVLDRVTEPRLAALVAYATTGDAKALATLAAPAKAPDDLAEVLVALRPIARGGEAEVQLVEQALATPAPAVQQAAVAVAGAAAQRNPDVYRETLVRALTAADPELRRIAFAAVRQLGAERAAPLYAAALRRDPDAAIRRELLLVVSIEETDAAPPSAEAALPALADGAASPALRERARAQLRRAFAADAAAAAEATAALIADENAPADARVFAIRVVLEDGDVGPAGAPRLVDPVRAAVGSRAEAVRAAALPLFARVAPSGAVEDIARIGGERLSRPMKVAVALAWGELARAKIPEAGPALERLIKDDAFEVRAAAAEAMGYLGRPAQDTLIKMVKNERIEVAAGAARGLARTADVGASVPVAVGGIAQLWPRKGRSRREAAIVFAQMAKKRPAPVMNYLAAAARAPDDPALHPIGAEGLCHAANQGNLEARRQLLRVTDDPAVEVRRMVIACAADGPDAGKNGVAVATRLVKDTDGQIRAAAARVLALSTAKGGKLSGGVGDALLALLEDPEREVRVIAVRAVGGLGAEAPRGAAAVLARAFERADEGEKLLLLRAGRAVGADELVGLAIADGSPLVRVEAVDSALATGVGAAPTVSAALADVDPQVRRAVLARLATDKDKLEPAALERALALAVRDPDPELRQLALTTVARVAPKEAVAERLGRSLSARAERERAAAAAAAIGLVERDAQLAVKLLTPLLADPSHDVRVAMLASLGSAYAAVNSPEQLSNLLTRAEGDAMKRLAAAAAFVMLARTDAGRAAASSALGRIAERGPTMARRTARLVVGLIESQADGIAFLEQLVP